MTRKEYFPPDVIQLDRRPIMWLLETIAIILLLGMPLSLVVLIPPVRRLGRQSVRARIAVIAVTGLLSFALAFGIRTG